MSSYEEVREKLLQKIKQHIREFLDRTTWSREKITEFQEQNLKKLLQYVVIQSPFYRERCQYINFDELLLPQLQKIKPSTKKDIMENWNRVVCSTRLSLQIAEDYLNQQREGKEENPFFDDYYYITATGGSSGLRGLFVWDLDYFADVACTAFRYQYDIERRRITEHGNVIAVLTAPSLIHASTPLFSVVIKPTSKAYHISADKNILDICQELNALQPTHLIGYSSLIIELAHQSLAGRLHIEPIRVDTNSEPLGQEGREKIREAWGVEVNNMWGSVEMGMLGVESDKHCGLILSEDMLIFEPVDDELRPVKKMKDTRKLIMTNLFNFTLPLIRYVVDDTVLIQDCVHTHYRVVEDIVGRSDDWFLYANDIPIHPIVFRGILGQEKNIIEYQVEQTEQGAIIRLVIDGNINVHLLKTNLLNALTHAGLMSPDIVIEELKALPRVKETGKLKRFIPLR